MTDVANGNSARFLAVWALAMSAVGWLAPRCGRPPLPQPPQEPPPRGATPNAAGGAALVGPGCRGAWPPGGIDHKYLQDIEKK